MFPPATVTPSDRPSSSAHARDSVPTLADAAMGFFESEARIADSRSPPSSRKNASGGYPPHDARHIHL